MKKLFTALLLLLAGSACQGALPTPPPTSTPVPPPTEAPTATPVRVFRLEKSTQPFTARETFQAGLGDLDGDGDLDAILANPQENASQVWINDGSGSLTDTGQKLTQYGHGVGLADFDSDGDLDAFITCHQFVMPSRVYLNDGTGMMADTSQDLGDKGMSGTEVNLLDLNGDGHTDDLGFESGFPAHRGESYIM